MIKNNKGKFIISSLIILLPILAAILVNSFVTPLIDGTMWGFVLVSLLTLAIHVGCIIFTEKTGKVEEQSEKVINITFWIIPLITNYVSAIMMAIILGAEFKTSFVIAPLLGFTFIFMGNYMPKARQNPSFGVRIKWTLLNEENWNATHRFSGKLWVICGIVMLVTALLPDMLFIIAFLVISTFAVVACYVYSYSYHKKQLACGKAEKTDFTYSESEKKTRNISIVAVSLILIFVAILMFTGKVDFTFDEDSLLINSVFDGKMDIEYSEIESVEYREERVPGTRIMGYASAKLLLGSFTNSEFGNYKRYTYTAAESNIILTVDGKVVVISADSTENTKAIYDRLVVETAK